jgi:predicted AAA+ superfamily ATPase
MDAQSLFRPRIQAPVLERLLAKHPVVVLHGARQTGKTTLARAHPTGDDRTYRTLDNLETLQVAHEDPRALLGADRLTLDEVQRHPEVLSAIKIDVDQDRRPGRFLLTGSANLLLMQTVSESLAGRAVYLPLPPLTWAEVEQRSFGRALDAALEAASIEHLLASFPKAPLTRSLGQALFAGGFPPSALSEDRAFRSEWLDGYVQTYLERDLRQLSAVDSLPEFRRLMQIAASRNGALLNVTSLANDAGLPPTTARRYLNLLEVSFQIHRLPAYAVNRGKRLIKSPKLIWSDAGLSAHLTGFLTEEDLTGSREWGSWVEAWVGQHLWTYASLKSPRPSLCHWRTADGLEVDFVLEHGRRLLPIEVKTTTRPGLRDAKGMRVFLERHPEAPFGILACECAAPAVVASNILAVPISGLLLN